MKNKNILASFKCAFNGLLYAIKSERNVKIDLFMTFLVINLGLILELEPTEWIICTILIVLVIGAELLNTAIEISVDLAMPNINPLAKNAKDIAAGGVLLIAIGSAIVGMIIFLPKIIALI